MWGPDATLISWPPPYITALHRRKGRTGVLICKMTKCPHLCQCKYKGAESDLKLNSGSVHAKEMLPKVILHWKEKASCPRERSLTVLGISGACGPGERRVRVQVKHLQGVRIPDRMQTGPEWQGNVSVWPESAFPTDGGLPAAATLHLCAGSQQSGAVLRTVFDSSMWAHFFCSLLPSVTLPAAWSLSTRSFCIACWVPEAWVFKNTI